MKRLFSLLLVLTISVSGFSQRHNHDFGKLQSRLEKSAKEIENPKKSAKPNTWIKRAELFEEVYHAQQYEAQAGMDYQLFTLVCGQPTSTREQEVDGQKFLVASKERTDFYFLDGKLHFIRVTQPLVDKPLAQAFASYRKALEVDEKGKSTKKIVKALQNLRMLISNEGVNLYQQSDYKGATEAFVRSLEIADMPQVGIVDTVLYYYTGLAAYQSGDYALAVKYFDRSAASGYYLDGTVYCSAYEALAELGEHEKGYERLKAGIERFPEQQCLVMSMIQYYISQGQDPSQVIPYLDRALASQPDNHLLYFIRGVVYDQLENPAESEKAYLKAVELKPDFIDGYYNLAALNFNRGVTSLNRAMEQPASAQEAYDKYMAEADSYFHKSIPYAQKVLDINANHPEALDMLKTVYFRYRTEPGMQAKYDEIMKRIEANK